MISGTVNADREAIIPLLVHGPAGRVHQIAAAIDTGFDGWLSLPPPIIALLGLPWRRRGRAELADGSESIFDIFEGSVTWDRRIRRIPIDEADTAPLVGMALLDEYELKAQIRSGGRVTIKRLPPRRRP